MIGFEFMILKIFYIIFSLFLLPFVIGSTFILGKFVIDRKYMNKYIHVDFFALIKAYIYGYIFYMAFFYMANIRSVTGKYTIELCARRWMIIESILIVIFMILLFDILRKCKDRFRFKRIRGYQIVYIFFDFYDKKRKPSLAVPEGFLKKL